MAVVDEPAVYIGLREIYDRVVEVDRKVALILEHDLPKRVDRLERFMWGVPASLFIAAGGIVAALIK